MPTKLNPSSLTILGAVQAILTLFCFTSSTKAAEFDCIVGWEKQVFSSYVIATASMKQDIFLNGNESNEKQILGDPNGMFGIAITSENDATPIAITITCDDWFEPSMFTTTLATAGTEYQVFPTIRYRYNRLSRCRQATPATVNFEVQIGDEESVSVSHIITLRPIHDCPFAIRQDDGLIDTSYVFAAYVNEQHPFVDKLLRESLDIGIVQRFTGYQSRKPSEVIRQVYSLWDLMVARDVRYSSITATAADSDKVLSQNVRLIEETVNNTQANCVDGAVLFVSLLRKIDIQAKLVMVPGHCFVAFAPFEDQDIILGLETTLVDAENELDEASDEFLEESIPEELRDARSWNSFVSAMSVGTSAIEENKAKFNDPKNASYQMIDIAKARMLGILPIPFSGNEEFTAFDHRNAGISNVAIDNDTFSGERVASEPDTIIVETSDEQTGVLVADNDVDADEDDDAVEDDFAEGDEESDE
jgi:hypothetical protein